MPRARRPSESVPLGFYDDLLAAQGGVCAICGNPPKTRRLHIDHDHATKRVRGLLCYACNRLLLVKGVTPKRLRAAADYLERGGIDLGVARWNALTEPLLLSSANRQRAGGTRRSDGRASTRGGHSAP